MKESVLCLCCGCPLLNIINYQHIYRLIEVDKIVDFILKNSVCVLHLKKASTDIQHPHLWIQLLCMHTNRIDQMCFSTATWAIDEHRIKLIIVRMLRNALPNRPRQLITFTFYVVLKSLVRV